MKRSLKSAVSLLIVAGLLGFWLAWPAIANFWRLQIADDLKVGSLGEFGDLFGSFNAFFSGFAFLAVAFTIRQTGLEAQRENSRLKKSATIQFFSEGSRRAYGERAKLEARYGTDFMMRPMTKAQIDEVEACDELRLSVAHILSFFEELGVGVNSSVFDLDIVDKLMGGGILHIYVCFSPWIAKFRLESGSVRFFDQFEQLALAIEKKHGRNDLLAEAMKRAVEQERSKRTANPS